MGLLSLLLLLLLLLLLAHAQLEKKEAFKLRELVVVLREWEPPGELAEPQSPKPVNLPGQTDRPSVKFQRVTRPSRTKKSRGKI